MSKFANKKAMNSFMKIIPKSKVIYEEEDELLIKQSSVKDLIKKYENETTNINKMHDGFDEITVDDYVSDNEKPIKEKKSFIDKLKRFKKT